MISPSTLSLARLALEERRDRSADADDAQDYQDAINDLEAEPIRQHLLTKYGPRAQEYIDEAEHQDGYAYWFINFADSQTGMGAYETDYESWLSFQPMQ